MKKIKEEMRRKELIEETYSMNVCEYTWENEHMENSKRIQNRQYEWAKIVYYYYYLIHSSYVY